MVDFNYTVKNGDLGLSYIFRDKARELGYAGNANKINWQDVMSIFDQIQAEESAEGEKLYSGGNDKTATGYGKSYVIKVGDVINLTKSQLDRIYTAMGFTKIAGGEGNDPVDGADAAEDAEVVVDDGVVDGADAAVIESSAKPIPKIDPNPPSAQEPPQTDNNPPQKGLDLSGVTEKMYNEAKEQSKFIRFLSRFGMQMGEVEISQEEKDAYKNLHDLLAKGVEIHFNLDGSVSFYLDYEYDENGKKTREITRRSDGSVSYYRDYERDENGNITRMISRDSDGSVSYYFDYEYDENGNITRPISRDSDGSVSYYLDNEYDENGNKTRTITRDSDGSVDDYEDYEYDENGNKTRTIYRNSDGTLQDVYLEKIVRNTFDNANKLLKEVADMDVSKMTQVTEADEVGSYVKCKLPDGKWVKIYYDSSKDVTQILISHDTTPDKYNDGTESDCVDVLYTRQLASYDYNKNNSDWEGHTGYGYNFDELATIAKKILDKIPE